MRLSRNWRPAKLFNTPMGIKYTNFYWHFWVRENTPPPAASRVVQIIMPNINIPLQRNTYTARLDLLVTIDYTIQRITTTTISNNSNLNISNYYEFHFFLFNSISK